MGTSLYHPLNLGNLILPGNLISAPLAGFSDRAYRHMVRRSGADLAVTEMVSCEALFRSSERTVDLMARAENEDVYGVQLFTGTAETAAHAARFLRDLKPSLIDLNCGCPVPKIIKSGAGSALMEHPEKVGEIVRALKDNIGCPVTVKIRSGITHDKITFREVADAAVSAGASMVTLHPRTRKQGYSGRSDWSLIRELKQQLSIPVAGSGDLFTPEDVRDMLVETGCDAVMLARGVIGRPWIFSQTKSLLVQGSVPEPPTPRQIMEMAFEHLSLCFHYYPEPYAIREMRKHLCAYLKGLPHAAKTRLRLVHGQSFDEYREIFYDYFGELEQEGL